MSLTRSIPALLAALILCLPACKAKSEQVKQSAARDSEKAGADMAPQEATPSPVMAEAMMEEEAEVFEKKDMKPAEKKKLRSKSFRTRKQMPS